jgi:hypothetical protein
MIPSGDSDSDGLRSRNRALLSAARRCNKHACKAARCGRDRIEVTVLYSGTCAGENSLSGLDLVADGGKIRPVADSSGCWVEGEMQGSGLWFVVGSLLDGGTATAF